MSNTSPKPPDPSGALRTFLFLDGVVRLLLWVSSLAVTVTGLAVVGLWPEEPLVGGDFATAWRWGSSLALAVVVYNVVYLLHLLVLRAPIPTPKEGFYPTDGTGERKADLLWAALASTLVRAKHEPPFPGFLVYHLANLPPLHWLVSRVIGPRSRSCFVLNPAITDPSHTEFGRNVTVGGMTSIIAHTHNRDGITLRKTVVEDDVMIGAHALVYSGCTIKRGAVVYAGSVVRPDTTIGENEAWGGVPARKIKDLPPLDWTGEE
jgi:hypothetical protein